LRAQSYHHGDLREALLQAVEEIVVEQGVEGVSLRAAARRVGVSHAAPTHHFGDKRGLLSAFATRGFMRFTDALASAHDADAPDSPEADLLACGRAYVTFALTHRPYFSVMFRPELLDWTDDDLRRNGDAAFAVLLDRVAACRDDADECATQQLALTCWSLVHGLAHLLVDGPLAAKASAPDGGGPPSWAPDAAARTVLTVLRDGLRAQPGWRPP
jgi:AcrR family transcriptional regulator